VRRAPLLLVPVVLALLAPGAAHAAAVGKTVSKDGRDATTYWTAARMKSAQPREKAKPGGGGGGGGTFSSTSYEPATYPKVQGKVFFTDNGANYVCSGTAVDKGTYSIVWTAGHCVADGGVYVTKFIFVPAYKNGAGPEGKFGATKLVTTASWLASEDFGEDSGAAVVGPSDVDNQSLRDAVGGRTMLFGTDRVQPYDVYGYPAAGRFNGQTMRLCHTQWLRTDTSATPATIGVGCDQTGGSSGGGWISSTGFLVSNVSYGYQGLKNVLFGPHLETEAQTLLAAAS